MNPYDSILVLQLHQQSSQGKRDFFILQLYQQPSWNVKITFFEKYKNFLFFGPCKFPPEIEENFFQKKYKSFLSLEQESSISQNIINFLGVFFVYFSSLERSLLKYRFFRLGARKFRFVKYKKNFFWENIKKFHFPKYQTNFFQENIRTFFRAYFFIFLIFLRLVLKLAQVAIKSTTLLKIFCMFQSTFKKFG